MDQNDKLIYDKEISDFSEINDCNSDKTNLNIKSKYLSKINGKIKKINKKKNDSIIEFNGHKLIKKSKKIDKLKNKLNESKNNSSIEIRERIKKNKKLNKFIKIIKRF